MPNLESFLLYFSFKDLGQSFCRCNIEVRFDLSKISSQFYIRKWHFHLESNHSCTRYSSPVKNKYSITEKAYTHKQGSLCILKYSYRKASHWPVPLQENLVKVKEWWDNEEWLGKQDNKNRRMIRDVCSDMLELLNSSCTCPIFQLTLELMFSKKAGTGQVGVLG